MSFGNIYFLEYLRKIVTMRKKKNNQRKPRISQHCYHGISSAKGSDSLV